MFRARSRNVCNESNQDINSSIYCITRVKINLNKACIPIRLYAVLLFGYKPKYLYRCFRWCILYFSLIYKWVKCGICRSHRMSGQACEVVAIERLQRLAVNSLSKVCHWIIHTSVMRSKNGITILSIL